MQVLLDILGNIGFDWRVALANLFNFIIIFLLLDKFIFTKVKKSLDERKKAIAEGVEKAQKADTALVMAEEEKKGILKEAQIEANAITADAHNRAKQTVSQSVKDAEREAKGVLDDAQKSILQKELDSQKRIEKASTEMVISGMEKVLKEDMTPELQEKMVKRITA